MGSVPTGGNTLKNIIIGVLTTVLAYVIVHFIFDKKSGSEEKERTKTATVEAWKLLVKYEEISTDNYNYAFCNDDLGVQVESMIYENDQLLKNYEILKAKPAIDEDMASFISRAISNTNEIKKIFEDFAIALQRSKENPSRATTQDSLIARLAAQYKFVRVRDEQALKTITNTLVEKYGEELKTVADTTFKETGITGKWKEAGIDKTFDFQPDHTLVLSAARQDYPGKWELRGRALTISFADGSSLKMFIRRINKRYFRFTINLESVERQCCKL